MDFGIHLERAFACQDHAQSSFQVDAKFLLGRQFGLYTGLIPFPRLIQWCERNLFLDATVADLLKWFCERFLSMILASADQTLDIIRIQRSRANYLLCLRFFIININSFQSENGIARRVKFFSNHLN